MSKNNRPRQRYFPPVKEVVKPQIKVPENLPNPIESLMDKMVDGREWGSLLEYPNININIATEIRRSISEIEGIRGRPAICLLANVTNPNLRASNAIDLSDDLPFSEMVASIPSHIRDIDIILITPGGSGEQVAKFVDTLRSRFDSVEFILPGIAMSAGTIFALSGENLIMSPRSYIGPIDPQIRNKDGIYIPAQALLTLLNDIQVRGEELLKKGQSIPWTDIQILRQIDARDLGNVISLSKYSINLVTNYLFKYKFKLWTHHSDGTVNTDEEKLIKAKEIAELLCAHSEWNTHSLGITREAAWEKCKLKIIHTEAITGLERAVRRFGAMFYYISDRTPVYKTFISQNYCIFRQEHSIIQKQQQ